MAIQLSLAEFGLEDRTYTLDEWQAAERRTGEKFEYHAGRLVPFHMMAGGTAEHSEISGNVIYALGAAVRELDRDAAADERCGVHTSDLKIFVPATQRYLYPDAAVICGAPEFDEVIPSAARSPVVVVEVLSPSSVAYDTGEKFDYYSTLDSLRDYVLISQEGYWVETRSRGEAGGPWRFAFAKTLNGAVELPALGLALPMRDVYRGITLATGGGSEGVAA